MMTDQEFEELAIKTIVDGDMEKVRVERVDKCFIDECHSPATHVSTFDGTEICAAHVESYLTKMRNFFEAQARKRLTRIRTTDGEQNGQTEIQRPEATGVPEPSDNAPVGIKLVRLSEVSPSMGEGPANS